MSVENKPKFGDKLHIKGEPVVVIQVRDRNNNYVIAREDGGILYGVSINEFDEYRPDPEKQLRERILKRWKNRHVDHAFDEEDSVVSIMIGDIIEFVVENIKKEE